MSSTPEIYILSFIKELPTHILNSLIEHNVHFIDPRQYLSNQAIHLLLFEDDLEDIEAKIEQFKLKEKKLPFITFKEVKNYRKLFKMGGVGVFDREVLGIPELHHALVHFIRKVNSLRLVDSFSGNLQSINTFKLVNHLYSGFYTDLMSEDIIKNGFDIVSVRTHFNALVTYVSYLCNQSVAGFPAEVHYGQSENVFVMQFTISSYGFVADYLDAAFEELYSINRPFANTLRLASSSCNFFNIQFLKVSGKIIFNSVWIKDEAKGLSLKFPSILISDVAYYEKSVNLKLKPSQVPKVVELKLKDHISTELSKKPLKGASISNVREGGSYLISRPLLLKEIIEFLESGHEYDELLNSELVNVKEWLEEFPNKMIKSVFQEKDYVLVLEALKDLEIKESIFKEAEKSLEELEQDSERKSQYIDDVAKVFQDNLLTEHVEKVSSGDSPMETLSRILGEKIDLTPEVWKIKKIDLNKKVTEVFSKVKSGEKNVNGLKDEVAKIFSLELNLDVEAIKSAVNEMFEGAAHGITTDQFGAKALSTTQAHDVNQEALEQYAKEEIQKRDKQILRMKDLIDRMRKEMNETSVNKTKNFSQEEINEKVNLANLEKVEKKVDQKDREIERSKLNHESIISAKNNEIKNLKGQLESLKQKVSDQQNKKIETNDGKAEMDHKKNLVKVDQLNGEIEELRKMQKTLNLEFMKVQEQNIILTNKLKKVQGNDTKSNDVDEQNGNKLNKIFEQATPESATLNSTQVEQENRDLKLKVKLLEEQVSRIIDKSTAPAQSTAANDLQQKRLEVSFNRLVEQSKKQEGELAQKKKEFVGLKQENQLLKHKVDKLERKLAISNKAS